MRQHNDVNRLLDTAQIARRCAWSMCDKEYAALLRRVHTGIIIEPAPGLFVRSDVWDALSYHEKIMYVLRAICARHPDWVLCGPSAAAAYGYTSSLQLQRFTHIAANSSLQSGTHGTIIAHHTCIDNNVVLDGVKVTNEFQTLFDCARSLDFENSMIICSMGLRKLNQPSEAFVEYCHTNPGKWGIGRALYVANNAEPRCENGGEVVALSAFISLHYETPQCQKSFTSPLDGHAIRPDFLWERTDGILIAGELDGREKYVNPIMTNGGDAIDVTLAEKDRETQLNMLNIRVVRFQMAHVRAKIPLQQRLDAVGVPKISHPPKSPFTGFQRKRY
jgi:hypothetical protein